MARPIKNTVDYFPHIIKHGKTMFVLESKYGNDGYAFWFKLLELLGSSNGQVYDYNNPADWEFMLAKTKVDEETANNILKTLASVNAIDKELLEKKLIWSDNFIKNIEDVYKRRKQEIPQKPISTNNKSINVNNNPININKNTQTKLKETKLNKTKEVYSLRFEEIYKKYPNRDSKEKSKEHFIKSIKTDKDWLDINTALEKYKKHLSIETWKRPKSASTWFDNWQDWVDYKEPAKSQQSEENKPDYLTHELGDKENDK